MRVKVEVQEHKVVQPVPREHVGPDFRKGRLRVSTPLLRGERPRRRDARDRRVQGHWVRCHTCHSATDHVFREHFFLFDLHLDLESKMSQGATRRETRQRIEHVEAR